MPPSPTISTADLSAITGLAERQQRNIAKAGYYPPPEKGQYDEAKTLRGFIRYQREQAAKEKGGYAVERELLTKAKREREEFELAVRRGEFIAKDEIGPALRNLSLNYRSTLQHKLEREVPPRLIGKTPAEQLAILKSVVDDICVAFSEGTRRWTREGE